MPGKIQLGLRRLGPASPRSSFINKQTDALTPPASPNLARRSLDLRRSSTEKRNSKIILPLNMSVEVESPPVLLYNNSENSSGAIYSGQLKIVVTEPSITLDSFTAKIETSISYKRPVVGHCHDCCNSSEVLKKWDFLTEPLKLSRGEHKFPFTYLFPGSTPATARCTLAFLEHSLVAEAKTSKGEIIPIKENINVMRAILPAPEPRNSMRIFPPTQLIAHASLQPIIHPIGDFGVFLRLEGVVSKQSTHSTRWKLRKLSWRIEEVSKIVSPACPRHAHKFNGETKGNKHEDVRVIGDMDVKSGWKSDWDNARIEAEFNIAVNPQLRPSRSLKTLNGLEISHHLVVEMVVAEELVPHNKPKAAAPTGAARVLRTQFSLTLTERAGMGISWDEESPPMYQDVPASPPLYSAVVEDCDLSQLSDDVQLYSPPQSPPPRSPVLPSVHFASSVSSSSAPPPPF